MYLSLVGGICKDTLKEGILTYTAAGPRQRYRFLWLRRGMRWNAFYKVSRWVPQMEAKDVIWMRPNTIGSGVDL